VGQLVVTQGTSDADRQCAPCAAGVFCPKGTSEALPCENDSWDHDADPATACVPWSVCPPGTRVALTGSALADRQCTPCAAQTFSHQDNAPECTTWRACDGVVLAEGSATKDRQCTDCQAGQFLSLVAGQAACVACAPETYSAELNASACLPFADCAPGSFVSTPGSESHDRVCSACPTHFTSDSPNATSCVEMRDCVPGEFKVPVSGRPQDFLCAPCEGGTFSADTNAAECTRWQICAPGSRVVQTPSASQDRGCAKCGPNRFSESNNAEQCLPWRLCPAGEWESVTGTATRDRTCKAWSDCPAGDFVSTRGSSQRDRGCSPCAGGLHSYTTNAASCSADPGTCAVGTVWVAGKGCVACKKGEYCEGKGKPAVACDWRDRDGDPKTPCTRIVNVEAASAQSCARDSAGTWTCWGSNLSGESEVPASVDAAELSLGGDHACGVNSDSSVDCWGVEWLVPVAMPANLEAVEVFGHQYQGCALLRDSSVTCWGYSLQPFAALRDVVELKHGCARDRLGQLFCMTTDERGNATGMGLQEYELPVARIGSGGCPLLNDYTFACAPDEPALGRVVGHTEQCALDDRGKVTCWGAAHTGMAEAPDGLDDVSMLSGDANHACALDRQGKLTCWGTSNGFKQNDVPRALGKVVRIEVGGDTGYGSNNPGHTCSLDDTGDLVCWGSSYYGESDVPADLGKVIDLCLASEFTCAIRADGTLRCFGGSPINPVEVPANLGRVLDVDCAARHICVVKEGGSAACWGSGSGGAVDQSGITDAYAISTGGGITCALHHEGEVTCWGHAQSAAPQGLTGVREISVGGGHACAIDEHDELTCWGTDQRGQASPPVHSGVEAVSAGLLHTCAIIAGEVRCWGFGEDYGVMDVPTPLTGLTDPVGISTSVHACAVNANGRVFCWGQNQFGEAIVH
jgi:alpha-tubulin suppressor-like RCC1 family protein